MNIHITFENEKWLREQTGSMAGIVNQLVELERTKDKPTIPDSLPARYKDMIGATSIDKPVHSAEYQAAYIAAKAKAQAAAEKDRKERDPFGLDEPTYEPMI